MKKFSPAFIGIGVSYAGLGEIMTWLAEHPQISDHIPATHYFASRAYENKNRDWYRATVSEHHKPGQLLGESSASYLNFPLAPDRIAEHCPDTKLIVVLRHPVRRMLAEYDALTSIDAKARRARPAVYIAEHQALQSESLYAEALTRYFGYYSALQLYVVLYEDLIDSPLETMQNLYEFLGVSKNFVPRTLKQFAPPPDEPKHPSLLYRGKKFLRSWYRTHIAKPDERVFPPLESLDALLSPDEWQIFNRPFLADAQKVSVLLNRDMVGYWNLAEEKPSSE